MRTRRQCSGGKFFASLALIAADQVLAFEKFPWVFFYNNFNNFTKKHQHFEAAEFNLLNSLINTFDLIKMVSCDRVHLSAGARKLIPAQTTALKSIKSLAPLLDRILVQRIKAETKTASGIYLPESSVKELNEARVLAVGPGGLDKEGKRVTPSVTPGDKVLIPQVRYIIPVEVSR